jgi:hypothetical protein
MGTRNSKTGHDLANAVRNRHLINQNAIKRQIMQLIGQPLWRPHCLAGELAPPTGDATRPDGPSGEAGNKVIAGRSATVQEGGAKELRVYCLPDLMDDRG